MPLWCGALVIHQMKSNLWLERSKHCLRVTLNFPVGSIGAGSTLCVEVLPPRWMTYFFCVCCCLDLDLLALVSMYS